MKLGGHNQIVTPEGLALARVSSIVKGVDNLDVLRAAPESAWRVFRHYFDDQSISPDEAAIETCRALGGYRHAKLLVEGANEEHKPIEWWMRFTDIMRRYGYRVAGPSWATGDYGDADWQSFRSAGWCGFSAIALHAYWADAGLTIWNALRYRQYWRPSDPLIVITECGRDRVRDGDPKINEGWVGKGGWRADGLSPDAYLAELLRYAGELEQDPYVIGATVFTLGGGERWANYELGIVAEMLAARIQHVSAQSAIGGDMALKDQFPNEYNAWVAAGGIEDNFLAHLVGIGKLAPNKEMVKRLAGNVVAAATQLKRAVDALPLP